MPDVLLLLLAAAAAPPAGLDAFEPLVGQCFMGEVADGAVDTHCFEAVYDGAHIRDRHQVVAGGQVVYAGETLYSRAGAELVFTYWNSGGGVGRGTALPFEGGICFEGSMRGSADAAPQSTASCWRWDEGDYLAISGDSTVRFHAGAERF